MARPDSIVPPPEPFEEFFHAHYPRLVTQARYVGASREEAEDAASEAMTDAYRNWDRLDDPRAWTRQAVVRFYVKEKTRGLDRTRARSRRQPATSSSDGDLTNWEEWQWIKQLLVDCVTPEQRQVIALAMDGYGPTDIAAALGLTPGVVRQRLLNGRKSLKLFWGAARERGDQE